MNVLYYFLIIPALKLLINLTNFIKCKWYFVEYKKHIETPGMKIDEYSLQIVDIFKGAGVKDTTVSHVENVAYGNLRVSRPSIFDNLPANRGDIINIVVSMFHRAIGVYRSRMIETINPLYWVELLIFLPKKALNYLGLVPESVIVKIFQIVYWVFGAILGFVYGVFKEDLDSIFREWIILTFN